MTLKNKVFKSILSVIKKGNIMKTAKLYKGAYCIAVYEDDDELTVVLDNAHQFADYFGIKKKTTSVILSQLFKGKQKRIVYKSKRYDVYFIKDEPETNNKENA